MNLTIKDLSYVADEHGNSCGGGYADNKGNIFVDSRLPKEEQLEILLHEVIDCYLFQRKSNRIRHKDIDPLCVLLKDVLEQWEKHHDTTQSII